jgi:outer membrane protein TolC
VASYQQQVLGAAREVENGIITYLNAREEVAHLAASVRAAECTVRIALDLYRTGAIDYTPVFVAEQFLAQQDNLLAQAQGDVVLGLVAVYRALGGGWELRLNAQAETAAASCTPATAIPAPPQAIPPGP